jgi:hypothetical protein
MGFLSDGIEGVKEKDVIGKSLLGNIVENGIALLLVVDGEADEIVD